ncbi:cyclin-B1-2-like isoform X2 [Triticum dicoccoides]|uniref:cyclin-B1-2-like isoform X2 n=1 Tax=Triticum dicoccoides TaxID=85692 RepID=UPI0018901B30|nr:cyclin-B1-2-like isoform X2 [Triticum dicoccoides]
MASGGSLMTKELGETHDVLRFGANDSVRGDLAPAHPVQATIHKEAKFWDEKKKFGTEAIYGSAFNIRRDLDAQILSSVCTVVGGGRFAAPEQLCRVAGGRRFAAPEQLCSVAGGRRAALLVVLGVRLR